MTLSDHFGFIRSRQMELGGTAAICIVATMIGALFAGSTVPTPLYVIYKQQFGFSQISLTLIYAAYVVGNLAALMLCGQLSDQIGRRRSGAIAMAIAIISALIFLFAQGIVSLYAGRILSGLAIGIGAGTGTAWLAELIAEENKSRATVIATSANFVGLGIGAPMSGVLADWTSWPLRLPFIIYLAVLVPMSALVWFSHETVSDPVQTIERISLRPQLSVPAEIRAQFVAPAVTGFGAMALVGFYAALAPSLLAEHLHEASHAAAGAVFLELAAIVAASIVATRSLSSRAAMLWALGLMLPSVALLVSAQIVASMAIMIVATAACAIAAGLGYRGSLQVVNQIAPEHRRAEVVSSYFVCGFSGNALPVIGVGVISTLASSTAASLVFAVTISVFALVALGFGIKYPQ
jgi:predicted MFS family arabinose efflux permease